MMSNISFSQKPETPTIIIERDGYDEPVVPAPAKRSWRYKLVVVMAAMAAVCALMAGLHLWRYYYRIGVPVSVSPAQNIEKLRLPLAHRHPQVLMTTDSVLGVGLDFYQLKGLKADIEFVEPNADDTTVYLYSRCADYAPNGKFLGSLVAKGEVLQTDISRLGYMAMVDGRMVIGIGRSDKVKDYVAERGGSFFRQFILLSDGVLPPKFHLHGKVERRAIARMGDDIYYVATHGRETMWDFADALREYGFIDAIYITGGNTASFYRTAAGEMHTLGAEANPEQDVPLDRNAMRAQGRNKVRVPWLVFRSMP